MNFLLTGFLMLISFGVSAADVLTLNVNPNQSSFEVSLAANPTTGFQWSVEQYDKDLLTATHAQYQKSHSNLTGAGGVMIFTFTLNKGKIYPKTTKIVFKYARPWEKVSGKVQNVIINFVTQ